MSEQMQSKQKAPESQRHTEQILYQNKPNLSPHLALTPTDYYTIFSLLSVKASERHQSTEI